MDFAERPHRPGTFGDRMWAGFGPHITERRRAGTPAWSRVTMLPDGSVAQSAALWRRVVARLIDAVLAVIVLVPLMLALGILQWLNPYAWWAPLVVPVLLVLGEWFMVAVLGQSLGKRAMGLWIVRVNPPGRQGVGLRPGWAAAGLRLLLLIPVFLPGPRTVAAVGLLANVASLVVGVADRPHHRTLHDRVAGTLVVEDMWL